MNDIELPPISVKPEQITDPAMQKMEHAVTLMGCDADYISISPLAIILADETGKTVADASSWETSELDEPCIVTAVYADGTETVLPTDNRCTVYFAQRFGEPEEPSGFRFYLLFDAPLETDGLTALRINDTEIPLK